MVYSLVSQLWTYPYNINISQISDSVYSWIGRYKGQKYGKAISMEFALFTTVFMCVLGGGAFLVSTLTVEKDRRVSDTVRL